MANKGAMRPILTSGIDSLTYFFEVASDGIQLVTDEGEGEVNIAKTGAGTYTIAPKVPGIRIVNVSVIPKVANLQPQLVSNVDSTNVATVTFTNNSGPATDTAFMGSLTISYDVVNKRG